MLQIADLTKTYNGTSGDNRRPVLNSLNLNIEKGESVAVIGPSGCGKTTLLNAVALLDDFDSGTILFKGKDISTLSEKEKALFRNKKIGMVFQLHHLLPQCTLLENVLLPTLPGGTKNTDNDFAESLLKEAGIWEQRFQKPAELSGGECQRAAVVRALINHPELVLADEPTGALDGENARLLGEMLISLNKQRGTTLIVVTHSMELARKMDKVYRLWEGKLYEGEEKDI
ncbi:MAG TPA: ABC transporter ATP-binding protein [Prolixibacteraceae bacterium]|nr:ABC transporter ATP-binding protein [Prolixibacteraceae bacterium]